MFIFKRRLSTFLQLNESSKAIQNVCRIFAENELKPVASQHDKLAKFVPLLPNKLIACEKNSKTH